MNMQSQGVLQTITVLDPDIVFVKVRKLKIKQRELAKMLKTNRPEISRALNGKNPELLMKINNLCEKKLNKMKSVEAC